MEADEKACPFCAETIKAAAKVCKHCGRDLEEQPAQNIQPPALPANEKPCPFCKAPVSKDAITCRHCGKKIKKQFFDGCGTAIIILVCALVALKILGFI